ncbi:MAG TPA: hypothetical protein VM285_12170 [Polyangia bacterium]|nr:hypothetical protein [Polyangia bacterium]
MKSSLAHYYFSKLTATPEWSRKAHASPAVRGLLAFSWMPPPTAARSS